MTSVSKVLKSRSFIFTLYNIDENLSDNLKILYENGFCKTLIFTHELGKDNNNPHIQGYMICNSPNRLTNIKKKINSLFTVDPNPHIEIARGSAYANYSYITKELKDYPERKHVMLGDVPLPPGKKRDDTKFESYVSLLENGETTLSQIEKEDLAHYVRHESHYLSVRSKLLKKAITPPTFVAWFSGSTGTGKTYTAERIGEELGFEIYQMDCHNNFFNNYNCEECAIWDDYRNGPITFNALLKITDRSGVDINIKGGKVFFHPKIMIFTSPEGIESARTNEMKYNISLDNRFEQLKRRVHYTVNFEPEEKVLGYIPDFEDVKEVSDKVINRFKSAYRYFLEEAGFGEYISKIKGLKDVKPIKTVSLMETKRIKINLDDNLNVE